MLTRGSATSFSPLGDQRGFTLVELLVATATGLVVCLALFAILSVSTRQETRLTDVSQANQLGRIAMTRIIDELHSACLAPGFAPVLFGSGSSELVFINAYSEEAIISKAYEHRIVWNEKAETLTDYIYPSNGGNWPSFEFSKVATPAGGVLFANSITRSKSGEKTIPIFRYYNYAPESSSSSTSALGTLSPEPLKVPLKEEKLEEKVAPTVASVLVSFNAAPSGKKTEQISKEEEAHRRIELSGQVTFSFSVPKSETPLIDSPCQ
jgi:type II secretory pathway pseudopilin PulG